MSDVDPMAGDFTYLQVANSIAQRIELGVYTHKLPAERSLAQEYGVAYQTVRRSMEILRERNKVITRQGRGTFVHPDARREPGDTPPKDAQD